LAFTGENMYFIKKTELIDTDMFEIFLDSYLKLVLSKEIAQLAKEEDKTPHGLLIDLLQEEIEDRRQEEAASRLGV
jgi:hypothetical protein|tara:strand:- start:6619 stop:6846 length:228 start_codon:yes stop_codon:yes gene_type:complete